jgi:hypothetical protein
MLLAAWRLEEPVERLRPHYDLVIETQISVPFRWADASYVHFPLVDTLKFYLEYPVQVAPL